MTGQPVYFNGFEDNALEAHLSVQSQGNFVDPPGIKGMDRLDGVRAFGFGRSDCASGCWHSNQSILTLLFAKGLELTALKFRAIELFGNWGSTGELYINGQLWPSIDFSRQPLNDFQADTSYRNYYCPLGIRVYEIKWVVWDITDNSEVFIDNIELLSLDPTRVDAAVAQPQQFAILQNYPNPFNASTTIRFSLAQPATVQMTVYNCEGQVVEHRDLGRKSAGLHKIEWNAELFSSGNYFCRIQTPDAERVIKLLLIKQELLNWRRRKRFTCVIPRLSENKHSAIGQPRNLYLLVLPGYISLNHTFECSTGLGL